MSDFGKIVGQHHFDKYITEYVKFLWIWYIEKKYLQMPNFTEKDA